MRLLLDEHLSPRLVARLADLGVFALAAPHAGLQGRSDPAVWRYAIKHDFAVVTGNRRDFLPLVAVPLHPGLIVLLEGGLRVEAQWDRLDPVVRFVLASGDPDFLVNRVVQVRGPGEFEILDMPPF